MSKVREYVVFAVVAVLFVVFAGRVGYWETHYNRDAIVVSFHDDVVTFEDLSGYTWTADNEGYKEGQKVRLLMSTNGTDSYIYDDEIVSIKTY